VPQPNGKAPQHHLSVKEIIERQRERAMKKWHCEALDMDFLIRERTGGEAAELADEGLRLAADTEQYKDTPDAPGSIASLHLALRAALPLLLDPETKEPAFALEEVDDVMGFSVSIINEFIAVTSDFAAYTKAKAEEAAKNSAAMASGSTSSGSPEEAAMSTSSPTPIR
jgi:hypothetical protein